MLGKSSGYFLHLLFVVLPLRYGPIGRLRLLPLAGLPGCRRLLNWQLSKKGGEMDKVEVNVIDLQLLAAQVSRLDSAEIEPLVRIETADVAHRLIQKMLGSYIHKAYQQGGALLQLLAALGIVAATVTAMLDAGETLEAIARETPTSSLQAAERLGQCHDLCAEIIANDQAVKAAWAAQIAAEQIDAAEIEIVQ